MDCTTNPADLQAAGEAIANICTFGIFLGAFVGYSLGNPDWPFYLAVRIKRFCQLVKR